MAAKNAHLSGHSWRDSFAPMANLSPINSISNAFTGYRLRDSLLMAALTRSDQIECD
jgi:hypothetical protein